MGINKIAPIIAKAINHLNASKFIKDQYIFSLRMLSKNNAINIERNEMIKPSIRLANKHTIFPVLIFTLRRIPYATTEGINVIKRKNGKEMNSENIKLPIMEMNNEILNEYKAPIVIAVKDSDFVTIVPPSEAVLVFSFLKVVVTSLYIK